MNKVIYLVLILFSLVFTGFKFARNQDETLELKDEPVAITPKEFYIENVIDERNERSWVVRTSSALSTTQIPKKIDFTGGARNSIKHFVDRNLPKNRSLTPILMRIRRFEAAETTPGDGPINGNVTALLAFDMLRADGDTIHLLDYNGKTNYTRSSGPIQDVEPTLRHMLEKGLIYLNTWMNKQAAGNINLAKSVKVTFTDHTEKPEGDTIYYSPNRPLTWADFKGGVPKSRFDAEVFATIGYNEETTVTNGVVNLKLDIKVCLPKSSCWVKDGKRDDYALNHEQRHFDIAKIAAEHFKQKIKAESLTVSNYDGPINVYYLDAYREMDALQKQYDKETSHGNDRAEQERWNEKIDKELRRH